MQGNQHTISSMTTSTIGMTIPSHRQNLDESYMKTRPAEILGARAAPMHGLLVQHWTTTDYSVGLYQRQAAFTCLVYLICFHNIASCLSSHHASTQVKCTMSSVTTLMWCPPQLKESSPRNSIKPSSKQQLWGELYQLRRWKRHPSQRVTNFSW